MKWEPLLVDGQEVRPENRWKGRSFGRCVGSKTGLSSYSQGGLHSLGVADLDWCLSTFPGCGLSNERVLGHKPRKVKRVVVYLRFHA